jgi:protein SCO1
MSSRRHRIGFFIGSAALTLLISGCGESHQEREYTLQGQILSVAADRTEAAIKHEEIKGFMAAMTMPYKVKDAKEYAGLEPGDLITSTLVVFSNGAYLKNVKKVGEAPLEGASTSTPATFARSGFELLKPGEAVPDGAFVDQDGKPRDFASLRGSTLLVTFIYTKCPMPTFCPLMDRNFAAVQSRLKSDPALARVHLVSISFDPATDTPAVLRQHAASLGADLSRWTFLTGDRDDIDRFAARFGVAITREMIDPTNITHNLRTAIVDPRGVLVKAYTGNEWTPEQAIADLSAVAATN